MGPNQVELDMGPYQVELDMGPNQVELDLAQSKTGQASNVELSIFLQISSCFNSPG